MSSDGAARAILTGLEDFLSPHGFRRRAAQTLIADSGDVALLVCLQRGAGEALTLDLGVYSLPLAERETAAGQPRPLGGIRGCHWRRRLAELGPAGEAGWRRLPPGGDVSEVVRALAESLARHGLPALAEVCSTARLRALWETGQSPGLTEGQRREYLALLS